MMTFGQEPKEDYCQKCIQSGHHRLIYHLKTGQTIYKTIKPKKIKGRCERCLKY